MLPIADFYFIRLEHHTQIRTPVYFFIFYLMEIIISAYKRLNLLKQKLIFNLREGDTGESAFSHSDGGSISSRVQL